MFPPVVIFNEPKSGSIFVPAIAALPFMSALTIVPSYILAEVTAPVASFASITDPFCSIADVTVLLLGVPIPTVDPMTVTKMLAPL